jgi:uncharacterized protein (TIGR03435 family)
MSRECHNISMQELAELLPSLAPIAIDRLVLARTQLSGSYDFTIAWAAAMPGSTGVNILDSLKQLGIKVERQTSEIPTVLIDRIEKEPTAN